MDVLGYTPNLSYVVAFTGTSAASALNSLNNSLLVRVVSDADCFIQIGLSPVATATTSMFLPAGSAEYFKYPNNHQIAVIQKSSPGNLYITEMSR